MRLTQIPIRRAVIDAKYKNGKKFPRMMEGKVSTNEGLLVAIGRILRPLFRVIIRNRLSFKEFSEIAKMIYVQVATQEFPIPEKKQTVSRVAVLSGLSRKEVSRVRRLPERSDAPTRERYNRAARVVAGWVRDPEFVDAGGNPRALALQGAEPNFLDLVRRHSGDMPARAVLDELLRVGAAERLPDGTVCLRERAYVPKSSDPDKVNILGTDVADLIATIDHNLQAASGESRFQRKVMYDNLPGQAAVELRNMTADQAQKLLERLDKWMSAHDRDVNPQVTGGGRVRAGIGIYYFEEDLASSPEEQQHD